MDRPQPSPHPRRPVIPDPVSDAVLLAHVVRYYAATLAEHPDAQRVLAAWGLPEATRWAAARLGLANGRLPLSAGSRQRLTALGAVTADGQEVLAGSIVIPLEDARGQLVSLAGCPTDGGTPRLVGPGGVLSYAAMRHSDILEVVANGRDLLALVQAGFSAVACLPGLPTDPAALDTVLAAFKGQEVRFWGSGDGLPELADHLRVQGFDLTGVPLSEPLHRLLQQHGETAVRQAILVPLRPATTELDLRRWQQVLLAGLASRGYAERTVAGTVAELRPFLAWLHAGGVRIIADLTPAQVEGYRTHLFYLQCRGRHLSLAAQANRLVAVKRFTRFLYQNRYTLMDVGAGVDPVSTPLTMPAVWLSEADTAALLEAPSPAHPLGVRNRALLELFYSTAMRNTELCRLTLDAVDLQRNLVYIRYGKGGKSRVVPLGGHARFWLLAYLQQVRPELALTPGDKTLFLTRRGRPFERISLAFLVRRTAHQAGLTVPVTPHTLRRACATHMLLRGAGLRHLQQLLGHASPTTLQRYTRIDIADLRAMHQRYHPRERGSGCDAG